MRSERITSAQQCAKALLHRFGVSRPEHIRVEAFAAALAVDVTYVPLDGAQAQLVRKGTRSTILISTRITDPAARRFSIAHELGHLLLDHPTRSVAELAVAYVPRRRPEGARDYEAEANAFASELLMPDRLLRRRCEVSPVDLEVPRRIATDFGVSILASAIRFTELASERCAAVFSSAGKVKWVVPSSTFTKEIARGKRLDPSSVAADYFATGDLDDRPQPVPADAWFDTSSEVEIIEHSICSHELGTVLSMLWIPEATAVRLGMVA